MFRPDIIEPSYPSVALDRQDDSRSKTATALDDLGTNGPGVKFGANMLRSEGSSCVHTAGN